MLKVDSGNGVDFQVLDSWRSKWWALKLATDAAVTVLKIDQIIMAKPAGGPKLPKGISMFFITNLT